MQAVDRIRRRIVSLIAPEKLSRALVLGDLSQGGDVIVGPSNEQVLEVAGACLVIGGSLQAGVAHGDQRHGVVLHR